MRQSQLNPFAALYSAARYYGARDILLAWLGRDHMVLPLLLPHGVEFPGQFAEPGDIRRLEPVYWATNRALHHKALTFKPSVLIPHPLLLCDEFRSGQRQVRKGRLIVGAPPGHSNDSKVLNALKSRGIDSGTVLIKRRMGWKGSEGFWRTHGFETLVFGHPATTTYSKMAVAFSSFEEVISTTMSSAVFFGAACGAKATLIRQCEYQAYELLSVTNLLDGDHGSGRAWIGHFAQAGIAEQRDLALDMLGADLADRKTVARDLDEAIAALQEPFDFSELRYSKRVAYLQAKLAILVGREGLASLRPSSIKRLFARPEVGVLTMKTIDYFIDGASPDTFALERVPYRRGITEPGMALDAYGRSNPAR